MISFDQIKTLTKALKTNESVVFREYLQLIFLSRLYNESFSKNIFFKGGTAIHLIYSAPRFSEDLDFTVEMNMQDFLKAMRLFFKKFENEENVFFKERKTLAGKRFLMTVKYPFADFKVFVNLDFSFREKIYDAKKSIITTEYPVLFTSYVYHLSKDELLAEKIRAILTREKGRDIYDLWFLLSQGANIDKKLISAKFKYYEKDNLKLKNLMPRINKFSNASLIADLKPFISLNEREKLPQFINYLKEFLNNKFIYLYASSIPGNEEIFSISA